MDNLEEDVVRKTNSLIAYKILFPSCKLDEDGIAIYISILSDVSADELNFALKKLVSKINYFPTVAEIRTEVNLLRETLNPDLHVKTADEAWREVIEQMKAAFPYKSPHFSTDAIRETVKTLGWMVICETSSDKMGITRAQFRDIYNGLIKRKADREENLKIIASMPAGLEKSKLKKLLLPE